MNCAFPAMAINSTGAGRSVLTINDLTWLGHAKVPAEGDSSLDAGSNYEGYSCGLAVRYAYNREVTPTIERLYLICNYSTTHDTRVGDLVEYRAPALTTGAITAANSMIEVRRWHGADWFPKATDTQWGGQSGWIGGLYWQPDLTDADGGVLWAVTWGDYNGAEDYQNIYAVKLSNTIISGNYATVVQKYGPWDYNAAGNNAGWKEVTMGVTPIPAYAQAAVGGKKYAFQGTYTSVSSPPFLQYGPNLRGISDLPTLATSTPWNSGDLISRGNAIMTHALDDAEPFGNAKVPGTITDIGAVERLSYWVHAGGVWTNWNTPPGVPEPISTGTAVNDAIYIAGAKYGAKALNFWVYMSTAATGGTRVVEYSKGSGVWGTLGGTWSHGGSSLTSNKNNFVLTSEPGDWATDTIQGETDYWIRVRITSSPSVGGSVKNTGIHVAALVAEDSFTGENWFPAGDAHHGLCWVYTSAKHGVLAFGRRASGYVWYGEYHGFKLTEEVASNDDFSETFDLTVHGYRFQYVSPAFYVYDPAQITAAAGNGNRNNIGPPTKADWVAKWPNIPYRNIHNNANDLRYIDLWDANVTFFDSVTNQVIWAPPRVSYGTSDGAPAIEIFQV